MDELELRLHRAQHKLSVLIYELGRTLDPKQTHDAGIAYDCGIKLGIDKLLELQETLGTDYLTPWE